MKKFNYICVAVICLILIVDCVGSGFIFITRYTEYKYNMSSIAFIIILIVSTILVTHFIDSLFDSKPIESPNELNDYVETGYEDKLLDLLKNKKIKTLFINGEFGFGKTTILDYVLDVKLQVRNDKILNLKFYDEYIEENYIDFLYEKVIGNTIFARNYYLLLPILLVSVMSIVLFSIGEISNKSSYIIFITVFLMFLKEIIMHFTFKSDKIRYIKHKLTYYEYIIIDDLDRAYISTKEVLKCIHFLTEIDDIKLLLLGDSQKIISEKDQIDILEKYYDYKFDIPKHIVLDKLIDKLYIKCETIYQIEYNDFLSELKPIWREMTPRKINQLEKQLDFEANSSYINITRRLFRSDYIFIHTLSINNKLNMQKFYAVIEQMSSQEHFKNKEDEIMKKISYLDDLNMKLTHTEFDYIFKTFGDYLEMEVRVPIFTDGMRDKMAKGDKTFLGIQVNNYSNLRIFPYSRSKRVYRNRIFDQPISYRLNSYISEIKSIEEIHENFEAWLRENRTISEYEYNTYCEYRGEETTNELLIKYMEKNDTDKHIYYVHDYIYNHKEEIKNKHYNIYFSYKLRNEKGITEVQDLEELKNTFNDSLEDLTVKNIIKLLIIANRVDDDDELELIGNHLKKENKVSEAIEILIEIEYPCDIFKMFGEEKIASNSQMERLLQLWLTTLTNMKERYNKPNSTWKKPQDKGNHEIEEFNNFKEKVCKYYEINVSNYYFSFDDEAKE